MENENDIYQQEVPMEEGLDAILPDGYKDGDDFFNPDTWTGTSNSDSATDDGGDPSGAGSSPETDGDPDAHAIEQTEGAAEPADSGVDEDPAPATGTVDEPAPTNRRKVKYQFDHQDQEEEIDLDADLPELLQKARSVDRYKERLTGAQSVRDRVEKTAKALNYESAEAFLDAILDNAKNSEMEALTGRGVPDVLAEDFVNRKYADASSVQLPPTAETAAPGSEPASQTSARDFTAEAKELLSAHPELYGKELPPEVYTTVATTGMTLLQAYTEHEKKVAQAETDKVKAEAEKVRKENRILKQNADSADRAPVSGVSKGGRTEDKESDPFLKGFNSIW